MQVRCRHLFFPVSKVTSLNQNVNVALAFSSREAIFRNKRSTVFFGTVTLLTKVTVSLRRRSERVGGCKVGVCAPSMYCLEIALLAHRPLDSKDPMQDRWEVLV